MKKFINDVSTRISELYDISKDDIFVVWSCKTLQNKKALLSFPKKGAPYFEATYNGDKNEIYLDTYLKSNNEKLEV